MYEPKSQQELMEKWGDVIDHDYLPKIQNPHKRAVTAAILENTETELYREASAWGGRAPGLLTESPIPGTAMRASSSTAGDGALDIFDPVLISLVRRAMPNLIAYDICGVQPMAGPTGLIFALRSRYTNTSGDETFYDEVNTSFSSVVGNANTFGDKHVGSLPGNSTTGTANLAETGIYNFGDGMSTAQSEALGTDSNTAIPEMSFSIEKVSVTAKARALKAVYTMETAQDMRAIHGLDTESELSNILSTELLAEINREVVRTIYITAKRGSTSGTTTTGRFNMDTDSNGRWSVEKWKGFMFHIEREANVIAKETRRGKGNIIICSSDVASALAMAGILDYAPALNGNELNVDDTGNTFVGVLNKRYRVYIDPYVSGGDFVVIGYKGSGAFDAGLFYCPYVPLQQVRAVGQDDFHPRIGFKTRYGMVANPFAQGSTVGEGALTKDTNVYYRRTMVDNLL
jgi:hypothetical protein